MYNTLRGQKKCPKAGIDDLLTIEQRAFFDVNGAASALDTIYSAVDNSFPLQTNIYVSIIHSHHVHLFKQVPKVLWKIGPINTT